MLEKERDIDTENRMKALLSLKTNVEKSRVSRWIFFLFIVNCMISSLLSLGYIEGKAFTRTRKTTESEKNRGRHKVNCRESWGKPPGTAIEE